jgi:hypothetical protein
MAGHGAAAGPDTGVNQDVFHAVANYANRDDYGTLILDRLGRIVSCGIPAERILGASQVRLAGCMISDFIAGLFLGGHSPSYSARYLVHLCADGEWRKFEARDVAGRPFAIELNMSRLEMAGTGHEMFLLNLRRPECPARH